MPLRRKSRPEVALGIANETVFAGDHIAYFYETDAEFELAFGFVKVGLENGDHIVIFGIPEDTDRSLSVIQRNGFDSAALIAEGHLSIVRPEATCDQTAAAVSAHFEKVFNSGKSFIRFLGNAAVGREGWPSEEEFYKLEATVSASTFNMPVVAICMFDLRALPAQTIMKAAFEGHPVTLHRNCIRENPYYVPRSHSTY